MATTLGLAVLLLLPSTLPGQLSEGKGRDDKSSDENRKGEKRLVVKRLQKLDDEELRKQLLLAPEVALDARPGSTQGLIQTAKRIQAAGLYYPGPALLARARPDLAGLPFRMGHECHLGKEPAENLQALSRKLRTHVEASIPRLQADPRPNPDRLREKLLGPSQDEWITPAAIPALLQLLQAENKPVRLMLVEILSKIEHWRSTEALAMRALVDLAPEVRESALRALRDRPREDYRPILLAGLSYPWIPVQQHAAEALVALKDKEAVPQVVQTLDLPLATIPFPATQGNKKVLVTRELVRVNHLLNCALCHAPSLSRDDLVRGAIPRTDRPLPPPTSRPYYTGAGRMIRADTTYLRQDFSVVQPVLKTAPDWPAHQRFDYLVRTRPLTSRERQLFAKEQLAGKIERLREPIFFVLRELTGKDFGTDVSKWRTLKTTSTLAHSNSPKTGKRGGSDWSQLLMLQDMAGGTPQKDPDPKKLARALLVADDEARAGILQSLSAGKGSNYTEALASIIPKLGVEAHREARDTLAERLTRLTTTTVREYLKDKDAELRRAAALAAGQKDARSLAPDLILLLNDEKPMVRRAAHASLKAMAGADFGPTKGADDAERKKAIAAWQEWSKKQADD
jgi:HEAT repeat protein